MVSSQATQPVQPSPPRQGGDSVRITAQNIPADVRRQVLSEFFADALIVQRAVTEGERIDRKSLESVAPHGFFCTADLRVSNAAAVQQWIASQNAAYADDNREFGASAVTR